LVVEWMKLPHVNTSVDAGCITKSMFIGKTWR
jgi:hypothetical protein